MRKFVVFLCTTFMCMHLFAQVQSKVKVDTTHTYSIANITVRGRYLSKELIPVQTLQGEELEKLAAHSVADAIRYFSGLQIKDYGGVGGLKTVNIRGMGSEHVGVFYDGIELGNAQNGTVDLGRFSLDNMESVTVFNGQKAEIFQSAKDFGSAGTVYMQTRTPSFSHDKSYNVKATYKAGSFGLVNPSALWEQRITKNISSSLNTEYLYTNGKYKFTYALSDIKDTTATRHNDDVKAMRIEYGLFGKIKGGEWRLKNYFYSSERGFPGAVVLEEPGKFTHDADRQWDTSYFLQGSYKKKVNEWYNLMVNGKYAYDYLRYLSDPRLDETVALYVNNHFHQKEIYLSTAQQFTLSPILAADVSVDLQRNLLKADLNNFVDPKRWTVLSAAAASLNLQRVKVQSSLLLTYVHESVNQYGTAAHDKKKFTPTIIISWQPKENGDLSFRTFYKRTFRMPTLNDLYYTSIGNSSLKPEEATQYDAGLTYGHTIYDHWINRIEMQLDGYYNRVKNKIVAMPTSNQFRWSMMNFGKVSIKGIDVGVSTGWQISKDLQIGTRITYTYEKAQDLSLSKDSKYYGGQLPYIPWNSGSVILDGAYRNWDWSYSYIYTGNRYTNSANIAANKENPYKTSDMSISHEFIWKKTNFKLTAEVNNLFNQQYEVVRCYPMPGRNMKIILNIRL